MSRYSSGACPVCGKLFSDRELYLEHLEKKHRTVAGP